MSYPQMDFDKLREAVKAQQLQALHVQELLRQQAALLSGSGNGELTKAPRTDMDSNGGHAPNAQATPAQFVGDNAQYQPRCQGTSVATADRSMVPSS